MSRSEISVGDKLTRNRHRQQSNSVGEVSDLSSHPSSHPSLSTGENERVSLFENCSQKKETTPQIQIRPLEASFIGKEISSRLELFATDTRSILPSLDFFGNEECVKSIGLETSLSDLFDRSTTAMFFDDIIQNNLIGDACNRSVGLQRSQSELFAGGMMTSNRRRRSNSAKELQSPGMSGTKNASPSRKRLQSLKNTKKGRHVSPCLKHDSETTIISDHFGDSAGGHNDKVSHKHRARGRQIKRTSMGDVAAGTPKRNQECSTQKIKKIVAEPWKTDDDAPVGESRQSVSKIRSRNTKRRKSEPRSRRSEKSRIDDKQNEWSRSKAKVGENPNENECFITETSGTSLETGRPVANESDLAVCSTSRARTESDDFSAQTAESSLPIIWNDSPKCMSADVNSSDSDGVDSDLSPRAPEQVRKQSEVDAHTLFREPCFAPSWKGSKDTFDEGYGFSCTEDDSSSFEGDPCINDSAHDSGVIVQFDAHQEGHVCHIRPDMAKASLLQIQNSDGSLMEGCIFGMPKTNNIDEETSDIADERPVSKARSSHRSSVRGFLFRRQKSVRNRWAEALADPEPSVGLTKMESEAHFDDLGRSEFPLNGLQA